MAPKMLAELQRPTTEVDPEAFSMHHMRSFHHQSLLQPDQASDASMTTLASGTARFATIADMERSREVVRFAAIVDMGMSSIIAVFAYHALITYHALYAECALDALMDTGR